MFSPDYEPMKSLTSRLYAAVLFAGVVSSPLGAPAATPTIDTFARLGGTADGYHAKSIPVQGPDGEFYGTTEAGAPGELRHDL